jgi:hypothetical protein
MILQLLDRPLCGDGAEDVVIAEEQEVLPFF